MLKPKLFADARLPSRIQLQFDDMKGAEWMRGEVFRELRDHLTRNY